jgi:hypothetical protein
MSTLKVNTIQPFSGTLTTLSQSVTVSSNLSVGGNLGVTGNTTLSGTLAVTSTQTFTGNTTINGIADVNNRLELDEIVETLNTKTGATGTVDHDFSTGDIWYHTSPSANWTVNLTNVPTTDNRVINIALIVLQGATARIPSGFSVDGVGLTLAWANNSVPTGNANKRDVFSFTLYRTGGAWQNVLGSIATFG